MPKGYIIARVTVHDADSYERYAGLARVAMDKYGARILARGGRFKSLEGEARARNVILEFESFDRAVQYWRSENYQRARAHRLGAADIDLCVVEGID